MVANSRFSFWKKDIKSNMKGIIFSLVLLALSLGVFRVAGDFVSDHPWSDVPDMILNSFGPYDLTIIFIYLFVAVVGVYVFYPLIYHPKEMPYIFTVLSIFIFVRSLFILFTHIGLPSDAIIIDAHWPLSFLTFSNDLFFSGHAGLPFLGYLIFRKKHKGVAYFMMASSIILAITVLLMHVHYSIDVFAAYFITYGIYKIGNKCFKVEENLKEKI